MIYRIEISDIAERELESLEVFHRRRTVAAIEQHLTRQPTTATRNCKLLSSSTGISVRKEPIWELRVGDVRVFYDVNAAAGKVLIRAVRRKRQGQTTKDIFHEDDES